MFILESKDVEYCDIPYIEAGSRKILSGLNYRGHLFVKVNDYAQTQSKNAVAQCRLFLDQKIPITSIIVREPKGISLWVYNDQLDLLLNQGFQQFLPAPTSKQGPKIGSEKTEAREYTVIENAPRGHRGSKSKKGNGTSTECKKGDRIHLPLTNETYEVIENDGLFVKTKNLKTGYVRTFSLVEIAYRQS